MIKKKNNKIKFKKQKRKTVQNYVAGIKQALNG
jgi:hypothetical protein